MASRPTFLWPIDERAVQERATLPPAAAQERASHPPPALPGFTASTHYIPAASPRSSAETLRADGFTSDATRFGEEEYARARQLTAESKVKEAAALLPFWIPPAEGHAGESGKATSGADQEAARTLSLTCYTPEHAAENAPVALLVHATGTTKEVSPGHYPRAEQCTESSHADFHSPHQFTFFSWARIPQNLAR